MASLSDDTLRKVLDLVFKIHNFSQSTISTSDPDPNPTNGSAISKGFKCGIATNRSQGS